MIVYSGLGCECGIREGEIRKKSWIIREYKHQQDNKMKQFQGEFMLEFKVWKDGLYSYRQTNESDQLLLNLITPEMEVGVEGVDFLNWIYVEWSKLFQ